MVDTAQEFNYPILDLYVYKPNACTLICFSVSDLNLVQIFNIQNFQNQKKNIPLPASA